MAKLKIIVGGYLGILPAGGVTWDYVQYPLGLSLLGHDVYYVEDTRLYPIYQKEGSKWDDCTATVQHLSAVMSYFGLGEKWAYRDEASGKCFGLSETKIKALCKTADVFINISCSTFLRDEYLRIPKKVLIDSDPMFTQIQYLTQQMVMPGEPNLHESLRQHDFLFTFGENIHSLDCQIPDCGLQWQTTRQPICLNYWQMMTLPKSSAASFTTLMNWTAGKKLEYLDESWGQKDVEFKKFLNLPKQVKELSIAVVVNQTGGRDESFIKEEIEREGWKILDPDINAGNWMQYQKFIADSLGEFSIAKETYVKAKTGWFSCRSACYLASGRPVIAQDTAWSKFIPAGEGLFSFSTSEEAVFALEEAVSNPVHHSKAARNLAQEYFDSNKVLRSLLTKIN